MSTVKRKQTGMFQVEFLKTDGANVKGEKEIYHASTANTLEDKGLVKILKEMKKYIPKTMKQ